MWSNSKQNRGKRFHCDDSDCPHRTGATGILNNGFNRLSCFACNYDLCDSCAHRRTAVLAKLTVQWQVAEGETKYQITFQPSILIIHSGPFHRLATDTFLFQLPSYYNSYSHHNTETDCEVGRQASPNAERVLRTIDYVGGCNYGPLQLQVQNLPKDMSYNCQQVTEMTSLFTSLNKSTIILSPRQYEDIGLPLRPLGSTAPSFDNAVSYATYVWTRSLDPSKIKRWWGVSELPGGTRLPE